MQYEIQKLTDERSDFEREKHMFEIEKRNADITVKDNHSKLSSLNDVTNSINESIKKEEAKLKLLRTEIEKEKDCSKIEYTRIKKIEEDLENRRKDNFNEQKRLSYHEIELKDKEIEMNKHINS